MEALAHVHQRYVSIIAKIAPRLALSAACIDAAAAALPACLSRVFVHYTNHLAAILVTRGASLAVSMETAGNEGHKRHVAIGCCQPGARR